MEDPAADIEEIVHDSDNKFAVGLDFRSSSVVKSSRCNQETDGDSKEKDEKQHEDLNQGPASEDTTAADKPEYNQPSAPEDANDEPLKVESEQAPTSTSTIGTSSSVSSVFTEPPTSAARTNACVGKPPLVQNMPQKKHISRVQGPTLGSILQRIHLNHGDVRELDFSTLAQHNKRLESEGCALVARSLSTNHTVRKLIIRDHAIGDEGAIALSKMLCNNTTLEYLDLYGNGIGDRGAEALAQALYGHDSLTQLCLQSNLITDRGAEALAQAIRCNCTLKSIELVHNRVTQVGAEALLDALDVNMHLETVNLDSNDVPAFAASQLAAVLARNRAESLTQEKKAEKIVPTYTCLDTQDEDDSNSEGEDWEDDDWEDDDGDTVSSGFLSCSGVTDIPLSGS
ncbi:Myosin-like protein, partial [Phytophthora palmivora]